MRVVVLGAAGGVGRQVVRPAGEREHTVVAMARTAVPHGAIPAADDVRWCTGVTRRSGGDVGRTALPCWCPP